MSNSGKNLGQVAGLVASNNQPNNRYIIWFDKNENILKYYNFSTLVWEAFPNTNNSGQLKLEVTDSLGYLVNKLHSSLIVSGGQLKVKNEVTDAERAKWNGNTSTYFVANAAGLPALNPSVGDKVIVADDGDGKRAGYYWSGSNWIKDFDPDWENVSLLWDNITDAGIRVHQLITSRFGPGVGDIPEIGSPGLSPSRIVETNAQSEIITAVKNSAYNKNFGTTPGTIPEIEAGGLTANTEVYIDSTGKLKSTGNPFHPTKIIEIGEWDMNNSIGKSVAHGLPDWKKIRAIEVTIRDDADEQYFPLMSTYEDGKAGVQVKSYSSGGGTTLLLTRVTGGFFDDPLFSATSGAPESLGVGANRGWVKITYAL